MRIKPAERKTELRHGIWQIPNDTELLDPPIPEASHSPELFNFMNQYILFWVQAGFRKVSVTGFLIPK